MAQCLPGTDSHKLLSSIAQACPKTTNKTANKNFILIWSLIFLNLNFMKLII